MKISVALAAYNGEKYIRPQLESVLCQLGADDEIIVSDDNPSGGTKEAVLSVGDGRIKYVEGEGKGAQKNFENALKLTSGDIIFLCDQDDVWLPGKVEAVVKETESGASLVLHDASVTDAELNVTQSSYFALHKPSDSLAANLIKNSFVGCCMAFTRPVLQNALPFPDDVPMHDWWIALTAIKSGFKVAFINEPYILWRRHGDNVTGGKTDLSQKLKWRESIIRSLSGSRGKDK